MIGWTHRMYLNKLFASRTRSEYDPPPDLCRQVMFQVGPPWQLVLPRVVESSEVQLDLRRRGKAIHWIIVAGRGTPSVLNSGD